MAASVSAAMAAPYTFTTITVPSGVQVTATEASGINDLGQVVGSYLPSGANYRSFIEDLTTGTVTTFYDPGRFTTFANGINNNGQIVGALGVSGGPFGYVRDPVTGVFTMLPLEGGFLSGYTATGINDAGQIVGTSSSPYHSNRAPLGFLYDPVTGTSSTFADPATGTTSGYIGPSSAAGYTNPYDINNRGQIVGETLTAISPDTYAMTGFLLDLATNTYTVIDVPGSTTTGAYGINDNGQVVGTYRTASVTNGFLLDLSTGTYTTLTDPGAASTFASGINNAGQIVGSFIDSSGTQNAFVATPTAIAAVPEPASLALLGGAICALAWARRRRDPLLG